MPRITHFSRIVLWHCSECLRSYGWPAFPRAGYAYCAQEAHE